MSDKYVTLQNFKYGLDGRKSELSSVPGTLLQCINGHINSGGEVEQRKTFAKQTNPFGGVTFGLQDTDSGLVTFGSRPLSVPTTQRSRSGGVATLTISGNVNVQLNTGDTIIVSGLGGVGYNGTWVVLFIPDPQHVQYTNAGSDEGTTADTNGVITFVTPLPTGVTYQILKHPTGFFTTNNITFQTCDMTAVVFSCNFNGKAFVVATFQDGINYMFYNGSLVLDSRNGLILGVNGGVETFANLSTDLAAQINLITNWLAKANTTATPFVGTNLNESALNGATVVEAPPSDRFTPILDLKSASGLIGAKHIDQNFVGSPSVGACVAFTIDGGGVGDTLDVRAPRNSDGTNVVSLTGGPVAFDTSLAQTATDVANAINNNNYLTGYIATVAGAVVSVCAPSVWGNVTFNLVAVGTGGMSTTTGSVTPNYTLTLTSNPAGFQNIVAGNLSSQTLAVKVSANVSVASGTNSFAWSETNADGTAVTTPSGIVMSSTTGPTVNFSKHLGRNTSVQGFFKCVATNSGNPTGSPATQYFSIYLEYDSTV
jgi:hypothetical protein